MMTGSLSELDIAYALESVLFSVVAHISFGRQCCDCSQMRRGCVCRFSFRGV